MNVWALLVLDNGDILAGTPGGIYRSANNGDLWSLYGAGLPNDEISKLTRGNGGLPDSSQVTALYAKPGGGEIFAGLFTRGMYRSLDNGISWNEFNDGLPFHGLQ